MKYNQIQLNKAIELRMNIHGKCECLNVLHQKFTGIFTFHGKKNFPFGRGITKLVGVSDLQINLKPREIKSTWGCVWMGLTQ